MILSALFLTLVAVSPAQAAGRQRASLPPLTNIQVSHDPFAAHSEPAIAENPTNHQNLIAGSKFFSNPAHYEFKIGTYYSMNGGRTWHDVGLLPGFEAYDTTSDVSIAFSAGGIAFICVLALNDTGKTQRSGIFVSRSANGGKSWSTPVAVFLDTTGTTFSDKPWIAVDQTSGPTAGNIYVAWNLDGNSDADRGEDPGALFLPAQSQEPAGPVGMVVSRSTDGGKTFSPPTRIDTFNQDFGIGAIPAVGPDGVLSIVYGTIDNQSGLVDHIDLVTSKDGGVTFSQPIIVLNVDGLPNHLSVGKFRNLTLPAYAVSPKDGAMVVVWAGMQNGYAQILASRSIDGGTHWSTPARVNHDSISDGKDHFQPALAVSPNGAFTCSWFDRRYDPNNRLIDVDVAQSYDDGLTFGHNLRVTQKSWSPAIDAPLPEGKKNNTFIGDYQALAADNTTVHPLWNDTQNGKSQQIRTAVVSVKTYFRR